MWVERGASFRLEAVASVATPLYAGIMLKSASGHVQPVQLGFTTGFSRAIEPKDEGAALDDSEVVGAFVRIDESVAVKRGQLYARLRVVDGPTLCKGYVYDGHTVDLGQFVEPGPGGGEGNFLLNPVLATTATGADFILNVGPASNAIWKIHEMKIRYTASATVGTRNVRLTRLDEDGVVLYAIADQAPTANQILDYIFTDILIAERSNPIDSNVAVEIQIRQYLLPEGHVFRLEDTGDISATDTVAVFGVIEEWLVV